MPLVTYNSDIYSVCLPDDRLLVYIVSWAVSSLEVNLAVDVVVVVVVVDVVVVVFVAVAAAVTGASVPLLLTSNVPSVKILLISISVAAVLVAAVYTATTAR